MGIKLNDEIATLICRAFLGLSNLWEHACLTPTLEHLRVGLIGACGLLGASTIFAIAADVLAFLTLPYFACYAVATFTFRQSLEALSALFDVFRGRKFNPLRNRTEPASYEVDALLLGTILFVVLSSIIPTIAAFYLAFASSRILLIGLQTLLAAAIGVLNTFPLFVLLVRLKSPHRLPGGTALRPCWDRAHWPEDHFHLEAHTMSYGTIFASLMRTTSENVSAGAIWRGLVCLCTGRVMWFRSQPRQA
ncbi:pig-Q [Rhodotorula sphaerocarpa]